MIFPDIDPIIISFGKLSISWYSLSYVAGVLVGWYVARKIAKTHSTHITAENCDDLITWVIIGVIVGGRLGYVLFYDFSRYMANPIDILKTYEGGMSFHGGLIGFVIAVFIYCKKNRVEFVRLMDICASVVPIGLFFGRIANFINAELYGRVTDSFIGVVFPNTDERPRHPSQLYEAALEGALLFCIMMIAVYKFNKLKKVGYNSGLFMACYGLFRIFIEFFREADVQIGYIAGIFTQGQLLCIPMVLLGTYYMFRNR